MNGKDKELRTQFARVLHKAIRQFEVEGCPEAFDMSVHIDQLIAKASELGYRRIDPEKLPVLSDEEMYVAVDKGTEEYLENPKTVSREDWRGWERMEYRSIAQAQLDLIRRILDGE